MTEETKNEKSPKRSFSMKKLRSTRKSNATETAPSTPPRTSASGMKRSKSFHRIRGILTGESRKERKARKKAAREAAAAKGIELPSDDASIVSDAESVYGIDLVDSAPGTPKSMFNTSMNDEEEPDLLATGTNGPVEVMAKKNAEVVKVILLLMEPATRRFELLQLEFDSNKAVVSDVLAQIPKAVKEEVLRSQKYVGVCDRSGLELIKSLKLSEFVNRNEVLIAIPEGSKSKEVARLARPILLDEKVSAMLRASGIKPLTKKPKSSSKVSRVDVPREIPVDKVSKDPSASLFGVKVFSWVILVGLAAVLLQAIHTNMISPLSPGNIMSPGTWRSKCGLLSPFPSVCENSVLFMSGDGVLSMVGPDGETEWKIVGGVCRPDSECTEGLVVKENGSLKIGGQAVSSVMVKSGGSMTPWPFEEEPKLRVIRGLN